MLHTCQNCRAVCFLVHAHYGLFTYVSSSGSLPGPGGGPGGAFGVGLGGGAFGKGGATRPGGAAGVEAAKSFSSAPHLGHLISFLPAVGGLKHIFSLSF